MDPLGFAYVVGVTSDPAYSVTEGAFQKQCQGQCVFATKLSPEGKTLAYSTFLNTSRGPDTVSLALSANLEIVDANVDSVRAMTLGPDGGSLLSHYTLSWDGTGQAVPDGRGNLLVTGALTTLKSAPAEGALRTGPTTAALLHSSDGSVLYSTRLPYSFSEAIAPDGSGGFIVLGKAGAFDQAGWALTRFVPDNRERTAVIGVSNVAETNTGIAIARGEIVQISGTNIGPSTPISATYDASGRLPFKLGGTQVWFNGIPAPVLSVAEQQVLAEAPFELAATGTVKVDLQHDAEAANSAEFPADLEPQVLPGSFDNTTVRYAAALNQDGSVNRPDNPASAGSVVSVFVNGAGAFDPLPQDGTAGQAGQMVVAPISALVSVGNSALVSAEVLYAGAAPRLVGIAQINVRIPPPPYNSRPPSGPSTLLLLTIGGATVSSELWVSVPSISSP